jgi:hypothetical protein
MRRLLCVAWPSALHPEGVSMAIPGHRGGAPATHCLQGRPKQAIDGELRRFATQCQLCTGFDLCAALRHNLALITLAFLEGHRQRCRGFAACVDSRRNSASLAMREGGRNGSRSASSKLSARSVVPNSPKHDPRTSVGNTSMIII